MDTICSSESSQCRRAVDSNSPIGIGRCDYCRQRNVKIKMMNCNRHVYCSVCEEFCPKLRQCGFKCKKCSDKKRRKNEENLKKVDDFFSKESGIKKKREGFQEVAISMAGSKIVSFGDDADEETDLSGNNTEWDFLLEPSDQSWQTSDSKRSTNVSNIAPNRQFNLPSESTTSQNGNTHGKITVHQDQSFLKLILPSTDDCETTSFVHHEVFPEEKSEVSEPTLIIQGRQVIREGEECERGTSPVKRVNGLSAYSWLGLCSNDVDSDDDTEMYIMSSRIEGPEFNGSPVFVQSRDQSHTEERDDFWDL